MQFMLSALHQYYEGSVSYPKIYAFGRYHHLSYRSSYHSVSNHPVCLCIALLLPFSVLNSSRIRLKADGSPHIKTETSSLSYGLIVHFQLLSTSYHYDAVTFCYRTRQFVLIWTFTILIYTLRGRTAFAFRRGSSHPSSLLYLSVQ